MIGAVVTPPLADSTYAGGRRGKERAASLRAEQRLAAGGRSLPRPGAATAPTTPSVRRVAIVYPHANLDTVPSLIGAAEQLARAGYQVDMFTYRQAGQPDPDFASPSIRLRSLGVEGLADHST